MAFLFFKGHADCLNPAASKGNLTSPRRHAECLNPAASEGEMTKEGLSV